MIMGVSEHLITDTCHLCGRRGHDVLLDVFYESLPAKPEYFRICAVCVAQLVDVIVGIKKRGEVPE